MADDDPYAKFGGSKEDDDPYAKFGGPRSKSPPKTETSEAVKRGFLNAASFNFYDELSGLARAGGLEPDDPDVANAIKSLFVGGYRKFKGDEEAERLYQEERNKQRKTTEELEAEHPYASFGGQALGAVSVPVAVAARAPTWLARAGAGALTGAGVGAVSGFGGGEDVGGSLAGGALGSVIGAGAGAALPAAAELVSSHVVRPAVNTVRGLLNRDQEAARRIGASYERGRRVGDIGLSEAEYAAAQAAGKPVAAVDLGGTPMRALARSAANTSEEARAALERTTQDRFRSQGDRLSDEVRRQQHFPNVEAQQEALDVAQRTSNQAAYRTAYAEGPSVWSPELERLTSSDEVVAAMRLAQKHAQSRAVVEGVHYSPLNSNAVVDDAGQLTFRQGANGAPTYPDLRFWDYTRRELSQAAKQAYRSGANEDGSRLKGLADLMNRELDKQVPSYQAARQGAARFFGAENALEAGQNFVGASKTFGLRKAAQALARMSPTERRLFQDGYADRLAQTIEKSGRNTNILNQISNSRAAQQEVEIALGRQGSQELLASLRVESVMDRMRNALGNSTTAQQLAALGLAGGSADYLYSGDLAHAGTTAGVVASLRLGGKVLNQRIDRNVAQRVGELLASNDPAVVQRGVELIARNPTLQRVLQAADEALARVVGQTAPPPVERAVGLGPQQ